MSVLVIASLSGVSCYIARVLHAGTAVKLSGRRCFEAVCVKAVVFLSRLSVKDQTCSDQRA